MKHLALNMHGFNETLFNVVDLTRHAMEKTGVYWPAMILVVISVGVQFFQSKQLMMQDKNARSLRQIFKDTAGGKQVDQTEIQAATGKFTLLFIPFMLFIVSISLPAALSLYWAIGGLIALYQQTKILRQDVTEMEAAVDKIPVEAEIISKPKKKNTSTSAKKKAKKRR